MIAKDPKESTLWVKFKDLYDVNNLHKNQDQLGAN